MKRLLFNTALVVGFLLSSISVFSQVEQSKKVNKKYDVSKETVLAIANKFGKVHINTWDKNQITVDVTITAEAKSADKANDLLDAIEIEVSESSSKKSFETVLDKQFNSKGSQKFEITYEVNMPAINPLELKSTFGDVYLADHMGNVDMDISYGNVKGGNLTGQVKFKLSFGNGSLNEVKQGNIDVKYSEDLMIGKCDNIELKQEFSNVNIRSANFIDVKSKYGDLDLGNIGSIDGSIGFSGFKMDRLEKSLVMETSHASGFKIDFVSKSFEVIDISGKFGGYKITLEKGTVPDIEVDLSFSDWKYRSSDFEINYVEKNMHNSTYRTNGGDRKGGKIKINSSYGDLILNYE